MPGPPEKKPAQKPPDARPDPLVLDGVRLPCYVKVAVYQGGQAAGLGIKATDLAAMSLLLRDPLKAQQVREMLRKQIDEELSAQGVTFGIKEEEIDAAVGQFVERAASGAEAMAAGKVAEGQPPEPGRDGFLEYPFNPGGQPLRALGREDRVGAAMKVNRVKEGDVLVVRHPPEAGQKGCDVRGEAVAPRPTRDASLEAMAGTNTVVVSEKLVAAIAGVCREDESGHVRVVQEVAVEEVNAATGDLPRTGTATTHFGIRKGVRSGCGVFTTENVFVREAIDGDTRIRARNLFVAGQVAGGHLPEAHLNGESEGLEAAEQRRIAHLLERSQIDAEELFGTKEVLGRNVSAGTILIQGHGYTSALDADGDILVDGNLSGGRVSFGGRLQVLGNLGDVGGRATHVRIDADEDRVGRKKGRFKAEIQARKTKLEQIVAQLDAHQEGMERHAKKSPYWAALLRGERRAPHSPVESRILVQFYQAAKQKAMLEQAVADCRGEIDDLGHLFEEMAEEQAQENAALRVSVGGTVYPGVVVEMMHPLTPEDLDRKVRRRSGDRAASEREVSVQEVKKDLAKEVDEYLAPRQDRIEERRQALDQMFKGREQRPHAPDVPNKKFQTELAFPETGGEASPRAGGEEKRRLSAEGLLYVYARDAQKFYLKSFWEVKAPLADVTMIIERMEGGWGVRWVPNEAPLTPWQKDPQVLERMKAIQVLGQSAWTLLLKQDDPHRDDPE